jgi:hypothetical protein
MTEQDHVPFDAGATREMQRPIGWTVEIRRPALRGETVPEHLKDLIPLARRWGVKRTSYDAAPRARATELAALSAALRGRHHDIEDWLFSTDQWSKEQAAFHAMVVLEWQECSGPGLAGLLAWAIRYYREQPTPERRERLAAAYEEVSAWRVMPEAYEAQLQIAHNLLEMYR